MIIKKHTDKAEDQLLLQRMKQGDSLAFDAIYERYWAQLYNAAYKRLHDEDYAKDITQDIFLQLWQRRLELTIEHLPSYLYTAVRNNVFKYMEKESRYTPISELVEQLVQARERSDSQLVTEEFMEGFEVLIQRLTPSQQEIFRLRYEEELGTLDIAARLNIARKTVQNQLQRSLANLRQAMGLVLLMLLGCP